MAIRAIVSDVGNVLVRFDPERSALNIAAMLETSPEKFLEFFGYPPNGASSLFKRWCSGRIRPVDFRRKLCAHFGVSLTPREFDTVWRSATDGLINPTIEVLRRARLKYRLPIVSCTDVDAIVMKGHFSGVFFHGFFDAQVRSCEVGVIKPHRLMYEHARRQVARLTGSSDPSEIIFFDDLLPNVEAAQRFGFHAYHCLGDARMIRAALAEHNLIV